MTIDRMDTQVNVTPRAAGSSASPPVSGGPGSPHPAAVQGTREFTQAIEPIVGRIIDEQWAQKMRIAGIR